MDSAATRSSSVVRAGKPSTRRPSACFGTRSMTDQRRSEPTAAQGRFDRTQALTGIIWLLGFWTLVVYCLTLGDFMLAVGAAFASLALPVALPVTHA